MEYFDIIDEDGNITGEVVERAEVHKKGLCHKSIFIWIMNSRNELLIQKRSATKDNDPNMWTISVTGHLSQGENSINGALKELKEEIGIFVDKRDLQYLFTVKEYKEYRPDYIDNELVDVFIVKKDIDIKNLKIQKEEVSDVKFIQYEELEKMIELNNNEIVEHTETYKKLFEILKKKDNKI